MRWSLDLRGAALLTEWRQTNKPHIGFRLRTRRLVSLADRAIGLEQIQFEVEEGETGLVLEACFAGLELGLIAEQMEQDFGLWRTVTSGKRLAIAEIVRLETDGAVLPPVAHGPFKWSWRWQCRPGQLISFERMVAVARGDTVADDPGAVARAKLAGAVKAGTEAVITAHEAAWAARWACSDVVIEGDSAAQQAIRFALYHLIGAANPDDDRVSIAARALTGEDYRGHVFWDTETYLLPFYTLTWPEAARAMLMYRFHTLDGARRKAKRLGWRGALYAWESAATGDEAAPAQVIGPDRKVTTILSGTQEQHISADIAYAVWQYWRATADEAFLCAAGAEILLETGRVWASRAMPEADGLHHIRGVIGPDEYHETIDDNAFTNVMARWNILRALETAALLRRRWPARWQTLAARLGLDEAELAQWGGVAAAMAAGLDPKTGLYEEFAGYFGLEDIDLSDYAGRSVPIDVVLGHARIQQSQVVKQADVVALLALLPEAFADGSKAANFHYYEPRCGQGSSLSRPLHGLAAARLGETEMALRYWRETAATDLGDTGVAIDGGVHIAAQGGMWLMAVLGFAGLAMADDDGIALDPRLPDSWQGLSFSIVWRGSRLLISIDQKRDIEVALRRGGAVAVHVKGRRYEVLPDQRLLIGGSRQASGPTPLTPAAPR
jgi:trehalose/maltose hydrolase-like predicted phosphorylase